MTLKTDCAITTIQHSSNSTYRYYDWGSKALMHARDNAAPHFAIYCQPALPRLFGQLYQWLAAWTTKTYDYFLIATHQRFAPANAICRQDCFTIGNNLTGEEKVSI